MIEEYCANDKIEGVTGVVLAGGLSRRMGCNKAFLDVDGITMINRVYRTLAGLFHEVLIVTNSPDEYDFLPYRKVPDIYPGHGSIAGLHSALVHSNSASTFVTACDMPFLDPVIIRYLCECKNNDYDAVIPVSEGGQEPLHAVYSSASKDVFENAILRGERKIKDVLNVASVRLVPWHELQGVDGKTGSFFNVNTPEEYKGSRSFR